MAGLGGAFVTTATINQFRPSVIVGQGFIAIAEQFEGVAAIEKEHEERYLKLLENVKGKLVFSREGDCIWQCRNCGHIHVGNEAPAACPVCDHAKAYFQLKPENY